MALKPDFNLTDAFKIFDNNYIGSVTTVDLREGLAAIGVFPTSEELDLFVARYDTTGDRRLNMREFSDAFLTLDAYYASMAERRGSNHRYPLYRRDDCFMPDTRLQFQSVWRQHFRSEISAESVRQRLQRQPYFNVYEAFNSLDMNDSGCISRDEFRRLIQSRGFYVSDKEATEIVEKMDKNKDGRVSFAEVSDSSTLHVQKKNDDIHKLISYPCLRDNMLINFCHYLSDRYQMFLRQLLTYLFFSLVIVQRGDYAQEPRETLNRPLRRAGSHHAVAMLTTVDCLIL